MTDPGGSPAASLQSGTERSRRGFVGRLRDLLRGANDDDTWEEVEETLIAADLGAELTMEVVARAPAPRGRAAGRGRRTPRVGPFPPPAPRRGPAPGVISPRSWPSRPSSSACSPPASPCRGRADRPRRRRP